MDYNYTTGIWMNWIGEQETTVDKWYEPKSYEALHQILQGLDGATRVRAVGSGHATSAVARPDDVLIDLKYMKKKLSLSSFHDAPRGLKEGQRLYRVEAGVTIAGLNKHLDSAGLALSNMGTFDGQKFIGAVCTGTHGSGLTWGPLADSVASIEMFTVEQDANGRRVVRIKRIEPHEGITKPDRLGSGDNERDMQLIINPDLFYASVVSMGCFGIVCAVTLKVVPAYWLQEIRQQGSWTKVRHKLLDRARETGHLDVWIHPNRVPGADDHACLSLRRVRCDPTGGAPPERQAPKGAAFLGWVVNNFGSEAVGNYASNHPGWFAQVIANYFDDEDEKVFRSVSHKVYVAGANVGTKATSIEVHVPLDRAVQAIDTILHLAEANEKDELFHTSPLGVRFIDASDHWLSMSYGRQTCSIEVPLILGTKSAETIMRRIEAALFVMSGRPHWGQWNEMDYRKARSLYPRFEDWVRLYRKHNHYGTFENKFTKEMGFPSEVTR